MIAFFDNDIILKLAHFDLLAESLAALSVAAKDVRVLHTVRFKLLLHKPDKGAERYGPDVFRRIEDFLYTVGVHADVPKAEDIQALYGLDGIHDGERILLAVASRLPDSVLVSGDKNCFVAFSSEPACVQVRDRLGGRLICLEQVVRLLIGQMGFQPVLHKIVPAMSCDAGIRAIFGSRFLAREADVLDGLGSYIDDLTRKGVRLKNC